MQQNVTRCSCSLRAGSVDVEGMLLAHVPVPESLAWRMLLCEQNVIAWYIGGGTALYIITQTGLGEDLK